MSRLTVITQVVGFEDPASNSNPTQKGIEWTRSVMGLPVDNPTTQPLTIPALSTKTVFNGQRSTSIDGTSVFSIAGDANDANRYRITNTGGTAPAFRTDRALACSGIAITVAVQSNLSVSFTAGAGTPFSAVQVGDTLFVPGASTGDSSGPFNSLNEGYWTVIAVGGSGASVTALRAPSSPFSGLSEVVTPSTNPQLQAYSAAGVQVGDVVDISAAFSVAAQHSYDVLAVNPKWIEFVSVTPIGGETGILPTAAGMIFYTDAKRFLRVEADQECIVRTNGGTENTNRLEPIIPGMKKYTGWFDVFGSVWSLVIVNKSTSPANVVVLSAE